MKTFVEFFLFIFNRDNHLFLNSEKRGLLKESKNIIILVSNVVQYKLSVFEPCLLWIWPQNNYIPIVLLIKLIKRCQTTSCLRCYTCFDSEDTIIFFKQFICIYPNYRFRYYFFILESFEGASIPDSWYDFRYCLAFHSLFTHDHDIFTRAIVIDMIEPMWICKFSFIHF